MIERLYATETLNPERARELASYLLAVINQEVVNDTDPIDVYRYSSLESFGYGDTTTGSMEGASQEVLHTALVYKDLFVPPGIDFFNQTVATLKNLGLNIDFEDVQDQSYVFIFIENPDKFKNLLALILDEMSKALEMGDKYSHDQWFHLYKSLGSLLFASILNLYIILKDSFKEYPVSEIKKVFEGILDFSVLLGNADLSLWQLVYSNCGFDTLRYIIQREDAPEFLSLPTGPEDLPEGWKRDFMNAFADGIVFSNLLTVIMPDATLLGDELKMLEEYFILHIGRSPDLDSFLQRRIFISLDRLMSYLEEAYEQDLCSKSEFQQKRDLIIQTQKNIVNTKPGKIVYSKQADMLQ